MTINELREELNRLPDDVYVSIKTENYGFWEIERIEKIVDRGKVVTVTLVITAVAVQA